MPLRGHMRGAPGEQADPSRWGIKREGEGPWACAFFGVRVEYANTKSMRDFTGVLECY